MPARSVISPVPRFVFAYNVVGYDGGDDFGYELYLDGFLHERVVLIDGRNGGGVSTDGWVTDTVRIPGTAQTARLEVYFDQNGDDVAGLDNLQLLASGTDGSCNAVCGVKLRKPRLDCSAFHRRGRRRAPEPALPGCRGGCDGHRGRGRGQSPVTIRLGCRTARS